jgi:hypothetical protein
MSRPDNSRFPTAAESEAIHRKVTLVLSLVGQDTDTAMTVLLYAMSMRAVADGIEPKSLLANFALIYDHVVTGDDHDNH